MEDGGTRIEYRGYKTVPTPHLLLLLLLALLPFLSPSFATGHTAGIFTGHRTGGGGEGGGGRHRTRMRKTNLALSPGSLRTHSMVLIVSTMGSVCSRVQGTWI